MYKNGKLWHYTIPWPTFNWKTLEVLFDIGGISNMQPIDGNRLLIQLRP